MKYDFDYLKLLEERCESLEAINQELNSDSKCFKDLLLTVATTENCIVNIISRLQTEIESQELKLGVLSKGKDNRVRDIINRDINLARKAKNTYDLVLDILREKMFETDRGVELRYTLDKKIVELGEKEDDEG